MTQKAVPRSSQPRRLAQWSAADLISGYANGTLSPVEVVHDVLNHIAEHNPVLNAFAWLDAEPALEAARASELRWLAGRPIGGERGVDGIPVTIKDLLLAKGWPTLRGSRMVDKEQPWTEDSPSAARLREHGAVILGKTTTSEFGWKALADSPLNGISRNPWHTGHTPGGSSGGAAAAAAIGFGPLHVGTDGGGSTRLPAAHSGVFGFKPSFGRVPGYPTALAGNLFHICPITRNVADAARLLNVIGQPDVRDWQALPPDGRDWLEGLDDGIAGLRIAYCATLGHIRVDPEIAGMVERAASAFSSLGAYVEAVEPNISDPLTDYRVLVDAGIARLFETIPHERHGLAEPGFRAAAARGATLSATRYLAAVQAREALAQRLTDFLGREWDLLITPTTVAAAPLVALDSQDDGNAASLSPFTYPFNLTQQPAASVPIGLTAKGLPVGLQIVGPRYRDDLVLRAARAFERYAPFPTLESVT